MANKQLTAKVKLNITDAERKLQRLNTLFRNLDKASNSVGANKQIEQQLTRSQNKVQGIISKVKSWANNQRQVTSAAKSTNNVLGSIGKKLTSLASAYLGIMGARTMINTSDTITKAQNKLNNLNGGDTALTQEQMDKMYASANKVRMGYSDMLSNASKSMTLAGDAFQGNMDNAIRFQEIMAESYALGGASAEEMSTSMYQMIQALGSGTLAGDELRSVREGAPLAYKAIEQFAQGIYNTEESLKDLASQGKITSEMVVAAIMQAGNKMDEQFNKTNMTFEQAWDRIKNSAIKAFEPVSNALNKMLNKAAENGAFEKIETAFWNISKVIQIVFQVIYNCIAWMADNWYWLKYVVGVVVIVISALLLKMAAVAVATAIVSAAAWLWAHKTLIIIAMAIMAIIYLFQLWKDGAIDTCTAISYALLVVAAAILLIGILTLSWVLIIVAVVVAAIALIMLYFAELCGYINIGIQAIVNAWFWCGNLILGIWNWCCAAVSNAWNWVCNVFFGCVNWISALWNNCVAGVVNVAMGLWNSIKAIATNIGIAFQNAWIWAKNSFWDFLVDVLRGVSKLEPVINGIAELLGEKGVDFDGLISSVEGKKGEYKSYVSVSDAWNSGMNTRSYENLGDAWSSGYTTKSYQSLNDAWNSGWNTYDVFQDGWASDAYDKGYNWGKSIEDSVNNWGDNLRGKLQNNEGDRSAWLDQLGNSLGLDFGNMAGGFPNAGNPAHDTKGAYNAPSVDDLLGDILNNTDDIADSMKLTDEDLEYLRKIAEMEWKKEYTTASIKVDMSNYNTINGESDLDGIVTKLADKLYEEMNIVADGVYA